MFGIADEVIGARQKKNWKLELAIDAVEIIAIVRVIYVKRIHAEEARLGVRA
jgi:hypothetical protein